MSISRSSVQGYQDSGGGGIIMRSLTYKLLVGFLSLTTLTTIGLGISTGVLSYQNGAIKERFKEQSLSLKECQVSCQQCSGGGGDPVPPTPSVSCSNMYKISGTFKVDEDEIKLTKYFTFGIENVTTQNGEDYTIEQVCQNTDKCDYKAQQAITVDNYGRLNISNLYKGKNKDELQEDIDIIYNIYNITWGMPWLYNVNQSSIFIDTSNLGINATNIQESLIYKVIINGMDTASDSQISIEASDVYNININNDVYNGIQVDGSVNGDIIFGKGTEDTNDMSDSVITGNIIVNGGIQGHVTIQKDITTIGESALKVGNIICGVQEVPITSNCVQLGNIDAYLGTNETPLAAIKLQSVTANNNGDGIQVEESITAPYSAIDVASDLSSSQYPVITVTGDIKATGNNDAISVSKNIILSGNGKGVYVIGYIQGNNQNDVINIMCNECEETQYGVTGGITIDNGVNGYVSLGNVACGSEGEGNGVEKCISIGNVEAYMYSQEVGKSLPAISVGQITSNGGSGIEVEEIITTKEDITAVELGLTTGNIKLTNTLTGSIMVSQGNIDGSIILTDSASTISGAIETKNSVGSISVGSIDGQEGVGVGISVTGDVGGSVTINGNIKCGKEQSPMKSNCVSINGGINAWLQLQEEVKNDQGVVQVEKQIFSAISIGGITANDGNGVQVTSISSEYNSINVTSDITCNASGCNGINVGGMITSTDGTGIAVGQNIKGGYTGINVNGNIEASNGGYGVYVGSGISVSDESSYGVYINSVGITETSNTNPINGIYIGGNVDGGIEVTGNVKGSGDSEQTAALYVGGEILNNGAKNAINVKGGSQTQTQYGVTGGITIGNGVNGQVSLGNVACGDSDTMVSKCIQIGDVEAYMNTEYDTELQKDIYYSAVSVGKITAYDGDGIRITGDIETGQYGVFIKNNKHIKSNNSNCIYVETPLIQSFSDTTIKIDADTIDSGTDAIEIQSSTKIQSTGSGVIIKGNIESTGNGVSITGNIFSNGKNGVLIVGDITSNDANGGNAIQIGEEETQQKQYQLSSDNGSGFKLFGSITGGQTGVNVTGGITVTKNDSIGINVGSISSKYNADEKTPINTVANAISVNSEIKVSGNGIRTNTITTTNGYGINVAGITADKFAILSDSDIICGSTTNLIENDCIKISGNVEAYMQKDTTSENGVKAYAAININGVGDNAGITSTNGQGIKVTGNVDSSGHALYVSGQVKSTEGIGVDIIQGIDSSGDSINIGSSNGVSLKSFTHGVVITGNVETSDSSINIVSGNINSTNGNGIEVVGDITATNGDAININGNVQNAQITITGNLYALDVSGQVGNSETTTAIKAGSVLGNIDVGTPTQTPINQEQGTQYSNIPLKAAPSTSAIQGSINVYGDMSCSNNVCVNIDGEIQNGNITIEGVNNGNIKVNQNNNSSNTVSIGEIYVSGDVTGTTITGEATNVEFGTCGTLNTSDITTALNVIYNAPAEGSNNPTNVIEKIALYDSSDTNTATLTVSGITNTPSITGLTNGNVQITTISDISIGEITISNIDSEEEESYNLIGSIKLGKSNDASPSVQISGIGNTFDINTITTPGTIESLDANITECPTNSDTITLSPPPKYLTLVFDGTSSMDSIKIQDGRQNDKIIISTISSSFDITSLTTEGTITNLTVEGTGSLANVSLVDTATIGTINIEVPATTPTEPSAVISNISLYPKGSTYNNSQLNIEGVYNNNSISKINAQGSIGTITASSIGSTDTSTALSVTNGITGIVSLGNVNCGNNDNPISTNCVSISSITNYGGSGSNAVSISSVTAHGGNGINVDKSVISDSGSAISVGEGLKENEIAITCGEITGLNGDCVSIANISASFGGSGGNSIKIGHIQALGGAGAYITSINSRDNSIQVEQYIDSNQGTAISVGSYIKTLSKAISITGKTTCGEKIDGGSSSPTSNNCVEFNDVEIYWDQPEAERKAAITVGNIKANNSNAIIINNITADYNGVEISNGIVSNNSQAINVVDAITCGTPTNDTDTGIDVTSSCVSIGSVNSYMDDKTTGIYAITIEGITATGGSGIQIDGDITADYNGIEVSNGVYINGNGIGFTAQNINIQSESGQQAIYITNSITSLSKTKQAVQIGGITCGNNSTLTTSNCVQMGDITIFGKKGQTYYPNATYINSITSYNDSNGIVTNGNVKSDKNYAIRIDGDVSSGASALYVDGNIYATSGYGVFVFSGVTCGTTTELNNYNCVSLTNVRLFGTTTAIAIKAQTIYANNGSNGIYVTSTVGGYTTKQSIYIGGQIECGNGGSSCVKLSSIKSNSPGINVDTITCGTSTNLITNNCVSIGDVKAQLTTTIDEDDSSNITYYSAVKTGSITANNNGYGLNVTGAVSAGYTAVQINGGITSTNIAANVPAVLIDGSISSTNAGGVLIDGSVVAQNGPAIQIGRKDAQTDGNYQIQTYSGYAFEIFGNINYENMNNEAQGGCIHIAKRDDGNGGDVSSGLAGIVVDGNIGASKDGIYVGGWVTSSYGSSIYVGKKITASLSTQNAIWVGNSIKDFTETPNAIYGKIKINGGVSGTITINNGGVDQISVDNSIGSLTAGGITTATINGNVGQLNILNVVEPVKESEIINVVNSINLYRPNNENSILSIGSITNKPSISSVTNGNVQINTITDESIGEIIISNIDTDPSSTYNVIGSIELENPDNSSSVQISGIDNTFDINTITTPGQIETLKSENINKDDCLTNSNNMTLSPPPEYLTLVFNDDSSMKSIKIQDENQNDKIVISGISKSFDITSLTGNSIGTITASSIGSTDTSTSTVLSVTNGITGIVSLGNVNCGNGENSISTNCVSMSSITNYGQTNSNAVSISSVMAYGGNGINVANSVTSDSGSAINVGDAITCGTPTNDTDTGVNVTSTCVSIGNVNSYMDDETSPQTIQHVITIGDITATGGSGIQINDITADYSGVEISQDVSINGKGTGIKVNNIHVNNKTGQQAIYVTKSITSLSTTEPAVQTAGITCGNNLSPTYSNCVQMGVVTTYGVDRTNAISTGNIIAYNYGNGVYVGGSINTNSGDGIIVAYGIIVNGSGNGVDIGTVIDEQYAIKAGGKGIELTGDIISSGENSIYINGNVESTSTSGYAIYVTKNVEGGGIYVNGISSSGNSIYVKNNIKSTNSAGVYVGGSINTNSGNGITVDNGIIVNSTGYGVEIKKGNNTYAIQAKVSSGGIKTTGAINSVNNGIYIDGAVKSTQGSASITVIGNIEGLTGISVQGNVKGTYESGYGIQVINGVITSSGISAISVNDKECTCPA